MSKEQKFKHGDIVKAGSTGCLLVLEDHRGELMAYWLFADRVLEHPQWALGAHFEKIGELTVDMMKGIEKAFLDAYKEKGNAV